MSNDPIEKVASVIQEEIARIDARIAEATQGLAEAETRLASAMNALLRALGEAPMPQSLGDETRVATQGESPILAVDGGDGSQETIGENAAVGEGDEPWWVDEPPTVAVGGDGGEEERYDGEPSTPTTGDDGERQDEGDGDIDNLWDRIVEEEQQQNPT